jgi:hypothetical protein
MFLQENHEVDPIRVVPLTYTKSTLKNIRLAEEKNITVEETPLETVYMLSQDLFSF